MTALFDRCPLCPRSTPGLCFAQTRGRAFCDAYAAGDRKLERLLTGDVEPEPALPGPLARAANFAGAVVAHISAGMPTLPAEAVAARLAVCHGCENFRHSDRTCAAPGCGCFLPTKAAWADQSCPLGRWPT